MSFLMFIKMVLIVSDFLKLDDLPWLVALEGETWDSLLESFLSQVRLGRKPAEHIDLLHELRHLTGCAEVKQ